MLIQQILKSWGIILPEGNKECSYLPEYLLQNHLEQCYFADFFPEKISKEHANKYTQIERKIYNLICDRMYCVVLKLWASDNLYFESELLQNGVFRKKSIKRRKLVKGIANNCIEKEQHLSELMQLSKENIIDLILIFENTHMVIVPSWSCFFVFIEDDEVFPFIKDAFCTEGLHLRKASVE